MYLNSDSTLVIDDNHIILGEFLDDNITYYYGDYYVEIKHIHDKIVYATIGITDIDFALTIFKYDTVVRGNIVTFKIDNDNFIPVIYRNRSNNDGDDITVSFIFEVLDYVLQTIYDGNYNDEIKRNGIYGVNYIKHIPLELFHMMECLLDKDTKYYVN